MSFIDFVVELFSPYSLEFLKGHTLSLCFSFFLLSGSLFFLLKHSTFAFPKIKSFSEVLGPFSFHGRIKMKFDTFSSFSFGVAFHAVINKFSMRRKLRTVVSKRLDVILDSMHGKRMF